MKPIVCLATILFAVGNYSAAPLSNPLKGSSKDKTSFAQREKNPPIKTVTCDWSSGNEIDGSTLADDNAVKLALYHAVVSGKGAIKAKKDCATIEGDPLPIYATAKRGKITITRDYSQDRFMSFKGFIKLFGGNSYSTRKVEIGYLDQGKFIPLSTIAPKDRRLFLRLKGQEYF